MSATDRDEGVLLADDNPHYGATATSTQEEPTQFPPHPNAGLSTEDKSHIKKALYQSHALYVWNSRVYEFGIVLFIINLFPGTLIPGSLFALVSSLSVILLSTHITRLVNNGTRLSVIKSTIFIQRTSAVVSASALLVVFALFQHHKALKISSLVLVVVCGAIERLCTIANKISVSRDWIVKITTDDEPFLVELNTRLRSIDLFCKLVGPLFISAFLTVTSHTITAAFLILLFIVSAPLEYKAILSIYDLVPALQVVEGAATESVQRNESSTQSLLHKMSYWQSVKLFWNGSLSPIIFALGLLYCTVLSFGNSTMAYLLSFDDINNFKIGVLRGVSSVFELFGTMVVFPFLNRKFGMINTGLIAVTFQFLSLTPIAVSFFQGYSKTHWMVSIFIPPSRVGLWCFDLALQNAIQLLIRDDLERFNATSFEESLNNLFELCGFISTLIFNKPSQFQWPVYMSVGAVGTSMVVYYVFWVNLKRSNGHLLK